MTLPYHFTTHLESFTKAVLGVRFDIDLPPKLADPDAENQWDSRRRQELRSSGGAVLTAIEGFDVADWPTSIPVGVVESGMLVERVLEDAVTSVGVKRWRVHNDDLRYLRIVTQWVARLSQEVPEVASRYPQLGYGRGVPPVDPDPMPPGVEPRCGGRLHCSPDFALVILGGEPYHLGSEPRQKVIEVLVKQWEAGVQSVRKETLLASALATKPDLRDVFRSGKKAVPAWGGLVVAATGEDGKRRNGWYRLNIPDNPTGVADDGAG